MTKDADVAMQILLYVRQHIERAQGLPYGVAYFQVMLGMARADCHRRPHQRVLRFHVLQGGEGCFEAKTTQ